jgi:hypothetical protein
MDSIGEPNNAHTNALNWNEATNTYFLSWYTNEHVVEIDRVTGSVLRVFGREFEGHYNFDPPSAYFDYQHHPYYTDAGTLLLMSTGSDAVYEYEVNDVTRTLELVWSFTRAESGINTDQIGEAVRLPNGNTFINWGTTPTIQEVSADKDILFEVEFSSGWMGSTFLIDDLYEFCGDC